MPNTEVSVNPLNDPLNTQRARYAVHTYSMPGKLNLKGCQDALFPGITERVNLDCLEFHISETEKIFIFVYGSVVFFNVPVKAHENYLTRIGVSPKKPIQTTTLTNEAGIEEEVAEDEVTIKIEPGVSEVGFNSVTIPEFDLSLIQMVAQVLAQSSALELIEWEVEEFLAQSEEYTRFLQGRQYDRPSRNSLLKFLGSALSAKHRIVTQLTLLTEPEKTWDREQLYRLYKDLFANFEIKERFEKIEKMLGLTREVTELLLEIVNARRAEILEIIVILLIAFEVVKSFL